MCFKYIIEKNYDNLERYLFRIMDRLVAVRNLMDWSNKIV